MFNFKTLKLTKRCDSESTNSFVGIRRNTNGEVEFRLPHGFDDFPENDFDATKDLFFKMYRTFKKFERDSTREIVDPRSNGKDQIQKEKDGYRFKNKEDNEVVLYSKIALIENLLDVYRDLALDQMERRIGADEKVDYSKIDRYLDRAIYLDKHVIYIDEMDLPRQTLRYESTTLIDLFCFIVSELQNELEQDIEPRVQELAHRFSEQHLSHEESLFNEETFETTIRTLKGVLDDINKRTAYKDEDYWRLYEAIETFLYGELDMDNPHELGTFWGISNFSSIWEDMCATWSFINHYRSGGILYADTNIKFNNQYVANTYYNKNVKIYKHVNFEDPFCIQFRGKKRWMRPDLIYLSPDGGKQLFDDVMKIIIHDGGDHGLTVDFDVKLIDKNWKGIYTMFCSNLKKSKFLRGGMRVLKDNSFKNYSKTELEKQKKLIQNTQGSQILASMIYLLDWKYMDKNCFIENNEKVQRDLIKQLCYEFTLRKVTTSFTKIENNFVIPWFFTQDLEKKLDDNVGEHIDDKILNSRLQYNGVRVSKMNFLEIQQIYLTHD